MRPVKTIILTRENRMEFTPRERRVLDMLSDGKGHPTCELVTVLDDELQKPANVRVTIFYLNKKLVKRGEKIISMKTNKPGHYAHQYIHIRLLRGVDE